MDQSEFINAIYEVVYKSSIRSSIANMTDPPGRNPDPALADLSEWYRSLKESEKRRIFEVVELAVDHAVFGMLTVFDGARVLDEGGATTIILSTNDGTVLNIHGDLHEIFRAAVDNNTENDEIR